MQDTHTLATDRFTSMSKSIIKTITTENSPDAISMNCSIRHGLLTDSKKNATASISLFGKKPHPNISCGGLLHGVTVFPAGISNVLQWEQNI